MFRTKVRKVGTSFGILIPKELVKEQKLREGQEIRVSVIKEKNMDEVFAMFGAARGAKPFKRDRRDRF